MTTLPEYKIGDIVIRTKYSAGMVGKIIGFNSKHDDSYLIKVLDTAGHHEVERRDEDTYWSSSYFRLLNRPIVWEV